MNINVPKLMLCFVMCPLIVAASVAARETTVQRMRFDAPPFEIVSGVMHSAISLSAPSLQDLGICIDWEADGVQPLKYVRSLSGAPGKYILSINNTDDFDYAVYPDEACPSGAPGVLRLSFKTGNLNYWSTASLRVKVPVFNAVGATLRLWVRHTPRGEVPSPQRAIHISLNDQFGNRMEGWRNYQNRFPSGEWHRFEVTQGDSVTGTNHDGKRFVPYNADVGDDLTRVSEVGITFFGYNKETGDDFYIGGLEVIPAVEPRDMAPRQVKNKESHPCYIAYMVPQQVKNLAGAWRLRPEGGVDGEGKRWFDPALDHAGFGEEVALGFWDAKNDPVAWYRKSFSLTPEMREKIQYRKVFLLFFGVDESCWLWLNGQRLGSHSEDRKEGWDKPFAVNVTERLRTEGENVLAVKVLNRENAGGIWKPVWLVVEE